MTLNRILINNQPQNTTSKLKVLPQSDLVSLNQSLSLSFDVKSPQKLKIQSTKTFFFPKRQEKNSLLKSNFSRYHFPLTITG
jgi:hypothetical protein